MAILAVETNGIEGVAVTGALSTNGDYYGSSLAATDDYLVVGSMTDGTVGLHGGSAYIYERSGGVWIEAIKLLAEASSNFYGCCVAVGGDVAVVGAFKNDSGTGLGAVYVYRRIAGVWTLTDKFTNPEPSQQGYFGRNVSMTPDGSLFVVGHNSGGSLQPGWAWVYRHNVGTGVWDRSELIDPGVANNDKFGQSVAIDSDGLTIVVGSPFDSDGGSATGTINIFEWDGTTWVRTARMQCSVVAAGGHFGLSVGIKNGTVVAAAPRHTSNRGRVCVIKKVSGTWTEVFTSLSESGPRNTYRLGLGANTDGVNDPGANHLTVAPDGSLLVQSTYDNSLGLAAAGAICIFTPTPDWSNVVERRVYPHTPKAYGYFGACCLANDKLLVSGFTMPGATASSGVVYEITDPIGSIIVVDTTPPTITLVSPVHLSMINPHDPIVIDVTDDVDLRHVEIRILLSGGITETVFDGNSYLGNYVYFSTRTLIAGGWRYTIRRNLGWTSKVNVTVDAIDTSGNKFP